MFPPPRSASVRPVVVGRFVKYLALIVSFRIENLVVVELAEQRGHVMYRWIMTERRAGENVGEGPEVRSWHIVFTCH